MLRYFSGLFLCAALSSARAEAQSALSAVRDSLKVTGGEIVIRNQSRQVQGFLFNQSNGATTFRKAGKGIQFTVGHAGFPVAGDSTYTHPDFQQKNIKVWRNGLLQHPLIVDTVAGRITFRPALVSQETVYIEALSTIVHVNAH
ncbi:hypothetical protein HF324_31980 [Chitinophaga oryzae]|uniref:Uncharacterized protein n=1 Tax=Chitinophaga oryzae TaxID=2725414 RepID=A0ABX6LPX9_9BACT|nr:hypothetical protein [Chitinophaga oryzae]QJB42211.1 hypothetical protein HF324_31980 [Chitinophaga oryzae]